MKFYYFCRSSLSGASRGLMLCVAAVMLAGCASSLLKHGAVNGPDSLIAQDMVNVLVQVEQLSTDSTVLHLSPSVFGVEGFPVALRSALEQAGYAIRTAGYVAGEKEVSYTRNDRTDPRLGPVRTVTVTVGEVSVRRSYAASDSTGVQPVSAMQVKGVDAGSLRLAEDIFQDDTTASFNARSNDAPKASVPVQSAPIARAPAARQQHSADSSAALLDIVAPSMANRARSKPVDFGNIGRLSSRAAENFHDLGESNFADLFDGLAIVNEAILTFENDSVRLGANNKAVVRRFVSGFNPHTDVLSVIGCSNGPTRLAMGQEGLALGRAERVREELLYAGVPQNNILEEGCWAAESFDQRMPRRGVVLTLKRRVSS